MTALSIKRVSVIGLGYIGLPTAAIFASCKIEVVGVDVNVNVVDTINRGEIHIVEPDLDLAVRKAVNEGYLRATLVPEPADAFLIAVPTPFHDDRFDPDLSYIETATRSIAPVLQPGNIVILESTSPVNATETMSAWLAEARPDLSFPQTHGEASDIRIAHCPERVLPGNVLHELVTNDRVIGGMTPRCSQMASSLYRIFVSGDCVLASTPRVAELAKLVENSFRDVNIAFANELDVICDSLDIDVHEVIQLANRHPRVNILQPGPGVGGHCIAVDPWFIVSSAPHAARLIRTAREVNDAKPDYIVEKVKLYTVGMANPIIACLGLTYKANVDDLRESPAVDIVYKLSKMDIGEIIIADPYIEELPSSLDKNNIMFMDYKNAIEKADIVVLLVDHSNFMELNTHDFKNKVLIDTRGAFSKTDLSRFV